LFDGGASPPVHGMPSPMGWADPASGASVWPFSLRGTSRSTSVGWRAPNGGTRMPSWRPMMNRRSRTKSGASRPAADHGGGLHQDWRRPSLRRTHAYRFM